MPCRAIAMRSPAVWTRSVRIVSCRRSPAPATAIGSGTRRNGVTPCPQPSPRRDMGAQSTLLSEFPRASPPQGADPSRHVTAGLLTALLYGLFALLAWLTSQAAPNTVQPEIVATLLPD